MRAIHNLSKEDLLALAPKIFTNARILINTGHDAAVKTNYGVACSLTILGTEELIKGFIVKLAGYGARVFEIKELSKIFNHHKTKHGTILIIKGLYGLFEISNNLVKKPPKEFKAVSKKIERIAHYIIKIVDIIQPFANFLEDYGWWETANELKNNGLYVNYINQEILPQDITHQQFETCANKSKAIEDNISQIIDFLNNEEYKDKIIFAINEGIKTYNRKMKNSSKIIDNRS